MGDVRDAGDARDGTSLPAPDRWLIRNISYKGHLKWSDPIPDLAPREFEVVVPAACGRRYLVGLVPKRFCFDLSGIAYGTKDHLLLADAPCR